MIFNPSRSKLTPENHLPNYQLSPTMELMNIFSTSILNPPCPVVFGHYQDKCIQLSVLSYILTTVLFLLFPPSSNFPLPPSYPKLSSRFTLLHDKKKKQTNHTYILKNFTVGFKSKLLLQWPSQRLFIFSFITYSNFLMQGHGSNHNSQSVSCKNLCPLCNSCTLELRGGILKSHCPGYTTYKLNQNSWGWELAIRISGVQQN